MRRFLTTLALAAALLVPAAWWADGPDSDRRSEMLERVRIVRAAALTEALELDEATAARLFPYLRETDAKMEEIHQARREHQHALRQMADAGEYPEREVDAHIEAVAQLDIKLAEARAEQVVGLKGILTPEQRVTFLIVQKRLEREIRRMMREERTRHRGERRERRREHIEDDDF